MKNGLGSRKRFLYRVIIYSLTPVVGFLVLITQWGNVGGMLLGGIGIVVGLFSQYLIFSRLQDPISAVKFVIQPKLSSTHLAREVIESFSFRSADEFVREFAKAFSNSFPDVSLVDAPLDSQEHCAIVIGEDLFFIISPSQSAMSLEEASQIIDELDVPLTTQHYHFIWLRERKITGTRQFE